jgi:hypothetical protein
MDNKTLKKLLAEIDQLDMRDGIDLNKLLDISDELSQVLTWMIRNSGFQAPDLGKYLGADERQAQRILDALDAKDMVEEVKSTQRFYPQLAQTQASRKYRVSRDVWKALE